MALIKLNKINTQQIKTARWRMSEWTAVAEAARRLRAEATQETPVVLSANSEPDEIRRACEGLVRLRARLRAARAAASAQVDPVADSTLFHKTMTFVGPHRESLNCLAQADSMDALFTKPTSTLTPEESALKRETASNLQRLVELDNTLTELKETVKEKRDRRNILMKEWEEVCQNLVDRNVGDASVAELENVADPGKANLDRLVEKMELMRELLRCFLTARSSYDFMEDKDKLLDLLPLVRKPFTMDMLAEKLGSTK